MGRDGKNKVVPAGRVAAISAKDTDRNPRVPARPTQGPAHATLNLLVSFARPSSLFSSSFSFLFLLSFFSPRLSVSSSSSSSSTFAPSPPVHPLFPLLLFCSFYRFSNKLFGVPEATKKWTRAPARHRRQRRRPKCKGVTKANAESRQTANTRAESSIHRAETSLRGEAT